MLIKLKITIKICIYELAAVCPWQLLLNVLRRVLLNRLRDKSCVGFYPSMVEFAEQNFAIV